MEVELANNQHRIDENLRSSKVDVRQLGFCLFLKKC